MARRFTDGSVLGPFGTAQLFITPSSSSRRSKCRCDAACFWITKRRWAAAGGPSSPEGSAVFVKSRFFLYSASCSRDCFTRVFEVATREAGYAVLRLLERARLAGAFFAARVVFFAVPCSR